MNEVTSNVGVTFSIRLLHCSWLSTSTSCSRLTIAVLASIYIYCVRVRNRRVDTDGSNSLRSLLYSPSTLPTSCNTCATAWVYDTGVHWYVVHTEIATSSRTKDHYGHFQLVGLRMLQARLHSLDLGTACHQHQLNARQICSKRSIFLS